MNREELAEILNVSRNTLTNWEKDKPDLVRLINQGMALDESIDATRKHLANKEKVSSGKFKLKQEVRMAKCLQCGKTYLTKECIHCRDQNYRYNKEAIKSIQGENINNNKDKVSNKLLLISITLIVLISILSYKIFFTNPLLGTWESEQKSFMGMNLGKIEFTKNKMIMMGIVSKVDYEIDGNNIYVTDEMGTGMIFKIIDNKTMYSEMIGMKTKYKKVK